MKIKYGKSATFIVISSSNAQLASYLVCDEMEFHREMFNKSILYAKDWATGIDDTNVY